MCFERLIKLKGDMAEIELGRLRNQFVPIDPLRTALRLASQALRRMGDAIQRRFGREAHEVVTDGLDAADAAVRGILA